MQITGPQTLDASESPRGLALHRLLLPAPKIGEMQTLWHLLTSAQGMLAQSRAPYFDKCCNTHLKLPNQESTLGCEQWSFYGLHSKVYPFEGRRGGRPSDCLQDCYLTWHQFVNELALMDSMILASTFSSAELETTSLTYQTGIF